MARLATGISGRPSFIFLGSFGGLIALGTILFSLPIATHSGGLPFTQALFMATSAVCVTGLSIVDVGTEFTTFGQWTLLALIQFGALGLMSFYSVMFLILGNAIPFVHRTLVRETLNPTGLKGFNPVRILRLVATFTFFFELMGTIAFYFLFQRTYPPATALKMAVFHAVSAFCNAGFSLQSDSFVRWNSDGWVNLVLVVLIVSGGLGFVVLADLASYSIYKIRYHLGKNRKVPSENMVRKNKSISLHSQIVLVATAILLTLGFVVFGFEFLRGSDGGSFGTKMIEALFLSVTSRTAGFNTVPTEGLASPVVLLVIGLMYFGASPGSTGGGVKTTTLFVLMASLWSRLRGYEDVDLFKKTIPPDIIRRASAIFLLGIGLLGLALFFLFIVEEGNSSIENMKRPFLAVLFEGVSAFGTVGLSMGITNHLSAPSLLILTVLMFVGRVGPLTLFVALSGPPRIRPRHPDELVMVG